MHGGSTRDADQSRAILDASRALRALRLLFQQHQQSVTQVIDLGNDSDDEEIPSYHVEQDEQENFIGVFQATVAPILESLHAQFEITASLRFCTPAKVDASYDRIIGRLAELIEEIRNIELDRCFTKARGARQGTLDRLRAEYARMVEARATSHSGAAEPGDEETRLRVEGECLGIARARRSGETC